MNVALDVTPLRLTRAGTARYIENLLVRIEARRIAFGDARRAAVLARELWWYPWRLSTLRDVDVLHCPTYYGPLWPRVPTVVTVHDLAVLRRPEWFPRWTRTYAPRVVPRMIRAATRVGANGAGLTTATLSDSKGPFAEVMQAMSFERREAARAQAS